MGFGLTRLVLDEHNRRIAGAERRRVGSRVAAPRTSSRPAVKRAAMSAQVGPSGWRRLSRAAIKKRVLTVIGTDDGLTDEVIVNGTAGDNVIAVVDESADVVAEGLAATIRIAHADPTLDRLTVNGLEGNDEITATPGAGALILLNLQP